MDRHAEDTMKSILIGLRNLWYWLPIIWQDRQWDHWFFLKIIEHKLHAMEGFFCDGGTHRIDTEQIADRISYCRILTTRIIQADYLSNALRYHEAVWGEAEIILGKQHGASVELKEIAVPSLCGEDREQEKQARYCLYNKADAQRRQDHCELFRLLGRYIEHWWD